MKNEDESTRSHKKIILQYGKNLLKSKKKSKSSKHAKLRTDAEEFIRSKGYRAETHTVNTIDGYVLTIHRIVPMSNLKRMHDFRKSSKQRVILHHGLLGSSDDWLLLGPEYALPYLLSDQGYDVWLLNARGNKYAREHRSNFMTSNNFWKFSWHEMGKYDLPAVIKYISKSAYKADTYFIGHSMGATALLVLLSTRPEYNRKIKSAILLAPLAFMYNVKGPLKRLTEFHSHVNISTLIDDNEFLTDGAFAQILNEDFCEGLVKTCSDTLLLMSDGGKEIFDANLRRTILHRKPAGTSTRTILHYMQLIKSGFFRRFDYGKINNVKRYFLEEPPNYELEKITVPISLISSESDWLAREPDITTLVTKLASVKVHHVIRNSNFDHMDFIWSKRSLRLVFEPVLDILRRAIKGK
ncbi:unnamed protein product [Arctia plantaginis]|uniref:Lipase n=1 Tax=Arctia plantaginis TaxID=874455 RepID=A0A8S0YZW2_ARCPL|nr:unnamed protein product [Arctia plantaginis]